MPRDLALLARTAPDLGDRLDLEVDVMKSGRSTRFITMAPAEARTIRTTAVGGAWGAPFVATFEMKSPAKKMSMRARTSGGPFDLTSFPMTPSMGYPQGLVAEIVPDYRSPIFQKAIVGKNPVLQSTTHHKRIKITLLLHKNACQTKKPPTKT